MVADHFRFGRRPLLIWSQTVFIWSLKIFQPENLGANILRGIAGAGVLSGFDLVRNAYIAMRTS